MDLGPNGTYVGTNASKYRLGALSLGVNGYEVGMSTEGTRKATQNWWHDRKFMHTARFSVLSDKFPDPPYLQYSTDYNFTLW